MGTSIIIDPIASALFPKARQAVIALLFGHPDESFYLREIVEATGLGVGNVQRELKRLSESGLLVRTHRGRHVFFQANAESPIYSELRGIARKTLGAGGVIREALEPLRDHISVAFLFGSLARGEERRQSDIDLMVIGELKFADVVDAIRGAESSLRREINPVLFSSKELASKLSEGNHFLTSVLSREKVFLFGDDDELGALSGK